MRQHDSGSLRSWLSSCLQRGGNVLPKRWPGHIWPPDNVTKWPAVRLMQNTTELWMCTSNHQTDNLSYEARFQLKAHGLVSIGLNWINKLKIDPTQFVKLINTNQGNFYCASARITLAMRSPFNVVAVKLQSKFIVKGRWCIRTNLFPLCTRSLEVLLSQLWCQLIQHG